MLLKLKINQKEYLLAAESPSNQKDSTRQPSFIETKIVAILKEAQLATESIKSSTERSLASGEAGDLDLLNLHHRGHRRDPI